MVVSVDVSMSVFKCVHVCLLCVLGDNQPTLYQRECSSSQLTPLSSLFTGVSEEVSVDQASVLLCSPKSEHRIEQRLTDEREACREEERG